MEWEASDLLLNGFTKKLIELPEGSIYIRPEGPLNFSQAVIPIPETPEEEEQMEFRDDDSLSDEDKRYYEREYYLPEAEYCTSPLLEFRWDGVLTWSAQIATFGVTPNRDYICEYAEPDVVWPEDTWRVIASLEPACPELYSAFFVSYIARNGEDYGCSIFGSLPSLTENCSPDLIREEAVREGYYRFVEYWGECWSETEEEIQRQLSGVNPRSWLLQKLGSIDSVEDVLDEEGLDWGESEESYKQAVLDAYFRHCYK